MGISENSHAKVDKETQSPLLKIFKEIMTRERDDPEKRNLLNEPKEDKKRRPYSVSKNKNDRRSCDSSNSSEHRKRGSSYKISSTEQRAEFHNKLRSPSTGFQSEKKNSWWCWTFVSQHTAHPSKRSEDTCSCGTCALKNIINSEYACVGCLILLFTISIIVAFVVVCKTVPSTEACPCPCKVTTTTTCPPICKECKCGDADSERLKRKIEMLNNKKLEKGFVGVDEFRKNNDKGNDEGLGHDVPGVSGVDFGPSFRELNSADETDHKLLNEVDLSNVLDPDLNLNNIDGSGKLREFYNKLVQTDAKIKSLKKFSESDTPYIEEDILKSPERSRRSLKLFHSPKRYRVLRRRRSLFGKHQTNETVGTKKIGNKTRLKRSGNESEEPTGIIIEKKKLLIQYKPTGKKRVPVKKCQHAPAGTHTHEKQLMHPFYKNTQRLDLLLDKFLNKNLPEIMTDPFGLDDLFKPDKLNKHCKHPKHNKNVNIISIDPLLDQIPKPKQKLKYAKTGSQDNSLHNLETADGSSNVLKILNPESTPYETIFNNHKLNMIGKSANAMKKITTPSTSDFEIMLSVSTIMNPDSQTEATKATSEFNGLMIPSKNRIPNQRRLMQIKAGEEEDNLGYEDFKEVLTDENANFSEMDKPGQRKRRESAEEKDPKAEKFKPSNPPQRILNPNWKGAMPLYPDEINSMITNKQMDVPKPTLEIQGIIDGQRKIRDLSDIEYVEDYLTRKYSNLVQQAQAYSDYGVLDGKKESRNEKESPTVHTVPIPKIKLLADSNVFKASLLERLKRGRRQTTCSPTFPNLVKGNPQNEASEKDIQVKWRAQTGSKKCFTKKKPEGISFQLQPTTESREDVNCNKQIMKMVSKHVKLTFKPEQQKLKQCPALITYPKDKFVYGTKEPELTTKTTKGEEVYNIGDIDYHGNIVNMTRGTSRHLLSTEFESSSDFRDYKNSTRYRADNTENNTGDLDRFIEKLHMNKLSESSVALKNYIEGTTVENIKIYGTAPTYYSMSVADDNANMLSKASTPSDQPKYPLLASNFKSKAPPDSLVFNNKNFFKLGDPPPENFLGKILSDPEIGQQHLNLELDVPIIKKIKEELMIMNDSMNYLNSSNQFDILFTDDSTINPHETETKLYYFEELYQNRSNARRLKREGKATATWADKPTTGKGFIEFQNADKNIDKASKLEVTVTIAPVNSSGSKSSVPSASSIGEIAASINIFALNATSKINRSTNFNNNKLQAVGDNMTLSDFFAVVGNWFKALEYGKMDKPSKSSSTTDIIILPTLNNSMESNITTTDSAYPMYDSDMIENIGHRSRVLLSVENGVYHVTDVKLVTHSNTNNVTDNATTVDGNASNGIKSTTAAVIDLKSNLTTTNKNKFKESNKISPPKQDRPRKFRAIVKRNADDSNLIFWDDIYDDEYGIRTDKIDNYMKSKIDDGVVDKRVKKKDFLKRSGRWVENKIRKFARKFNPHSDAMASIRSDKERVSRSIGQDDNFGLVNYPELHDDRVFKNPVLREKEGRDEVEEDYPDVDQKSLFAALSINMKEICKKAAKAVQETRNAGKLPFSLMKNEGSDDESKQGSIANALMQQLVRLLTDLVDYQVQQKTCMKLTPELQSFLEWLTYPKDEMEYPEKEAVTVMQNDLLFKPPAPEDDVLEQDELQDSPDGSKVFPDKYDFLNAAKAGDRQENVLHGDRIKYLEAIQSIQELLEDYDDMEDNEKSKMTGVKGYLEKQLLFLNNQLSAYDLFAFFDKRNSKKPNQFFDYDRKKRHISMMLQQTTKRRQRRKPHKFIKNFGRKHTKTTAGYNDDAQVTDIMIKKNANENAEINHNENLPQELSKRNLKDVYYNAVAEAKKFSTAKRGPIHKKEEISTFGTTTAKRQH